MIKENTKMDFKSYLLDLSKQGQPIPGDLQYIDNQGNVTNPGAWQESTQGYSGYGVPDTQSATDAANKIKELYNTYYTTTDQYKAEQEAAAKAAEDARIQAYNRGYLNEQKSDLEKLLSRYDTQLGTGLQGVEQSYTNELGRANQDKEKALAGYGEQKMTAEKNKGSAFSAANKNASNAYRSLAQILGRAGGTGSSAFQFMLPNVVGNALNTNRQGAIETYGQNMQGIKKNEDQYGLDFQQVLKDLQDQKMQNEQQLRGSIDAGKAGVNTQLSQILAAIAQNENPNVDYATIQAQTAPYKANAAALNASADQYNAWTPKFTPGKAVATATPLNEFTANRFAINQQNNQGQNSNPYEALLRKKLTEEA
jgi:hypothetical protein